MSKSLGNVVDPLDLREEFGTDAVRWFLMREMPTGQDASFTPERFLTRYDELANILGNLVHRVVSMVARYTDGVVPDSPGTGLQEDMEAALAAMGAGMTEYRLHEAVSSAMELAREANAYIETQEPWALAKDPARNEELDETLASLVRCLAYLSALFVPVTPVKAQLLAERIGLETVPTLPELAELDMAGRTVQRGDPLFPRIEIED